MLRIEYVCHSCLHIDTGDTTLVFDPWFKGTAYKGQWYLFPQPVKTDMLPGTENILFSHGHNDHLHEESLKELNKNAHVFFPYQWKKGAKDYLRQLGYKKITEAVTYTPYRVSENTKITYIGFSLESVIVIESNDQVIVNLNDALNSHHENIVQMFLKEILKRWKKIDYLFSGWSGAGYFPNTVHYKLKDDYEVGKLREQYFAHNFCRFVKYLQPVRAMAFAPGFALLAEDKKWINEVKFSRNEVEKYYRENFESENNIQFYNMNPGDYFYNDKFHAVSPYYPKIKNGSLQHLIEEEYKNEIFEFNREIFASEETVPDLKNNMEKCLNDNSALYNVKVLQDACFAVIINDLETKNVFNVDFCHDKFIVTRSDKTFASRKLHIRTKSHLLNYSFEREWGADAMTIGYGLDVDVFEESSLEKNLDIICVRLLSRYPRASQYMLRQPLRALTWFVVNPMMSKLAIKQKLMLKAAVNKYPYNERDHWISYSKCELCKVCNMPLLSYEFGERLADPA